MPKSRRPRQTASQEKYKREVKNLRNRVKRAEKAGFVFSPDIIPSVLNLPRRVAKAAIDAVKKIRGEILYKKATGFIDVKDNDYRTEPVSFGIEKVKEKRKQTNIRNLRGKPIEVKEYERHLANGNSLLQKFNSLNESDKFTFIRSLSEEDYKDLMDAVDREQEVYNGRREADTGRETGKTLLPDEGTESEEIPEAKEHYEDDFEPEGTEATQAQDDERKKINAEITDQKVKQWKENYERQKKKKKAEREYVYDGDAIYAGILSRIEQFEVDYNAQPDRFNKYGNKNAEVSFKRMLNNTIRTDGFSTVMRRLDGRGIEIDNALETMLYDSDENKVSGALMQLAEIILGRIPTQQESEKIHSYSEYINFDEEDEDLEDYQIDELI